MTSEVEAAAERYEADEYDHSRGMRDEYYEPILKHDDRNRLADWAVARLAADRAEREEQARPIDAERVVAVAARLRSYDTCNDDDIDEAAGLLLDLLRVLKGGA